MQKIVALSVTEDKLTACMSSVQDMMDAKWLIYSMGLQVKISQIDNKGVMDLV